METPTMKQIKYTPQGFSYIDVNYLDVLLWGGACICDGCNRGPFKNMKLIFVLRDTYCEDCFNEWVKRCDKYAIEDIEHDLRYQRDMHKEWYEIHLGKGYVKE